jgi:hypothetical protein
VEQPPETLDRSSSTYWSQFESYDIGNYTDVQRDQALHDVQLVDNSRDRHGWPRRGPCQEFEAVEARQLEVNHEHVHRPRTEMPGMSGEDLLDALRKGGVTVPVILMSGKPTTLPEGFFGLLSKPFGLREVAEVVTAALHRGRSERA